MKLAQSKIQLLDHHLYFWVIYWVQVEVVEEVEVLKHSMLKYSTLNVKSMFLCCKIVFCQYDSGKMCTWGFW